MKQPESFRYKDWLVFAGEDIAMAKLAMEEKIYNQTCFHAQQTAEKSLKAFIKANTRSIPKVHNLIELFRISFDINNKVEPLRSACEYLNRFYAPTRYPDAFPGSLAERLPNEEEAKTALEKCLVVYDVVSGLLGQK